MLAGFDCRDASVATYGYNLSVVLRKRSITLPELACDHRDVDRIARCLPAGLAEGFLGDIAALNW